MLKNFLSEQLRLRYSAARKTAATIVKQSKENTIWTKVGYRLQIGKQSILANHTSFREKRTPVAIFIEDTNGVLLKHQKGILNRWIE